MDESEWTVWPYGYLRLRFHITPFSMTPFSVSIENDAFADAYVFKLLHFEQSFQMSPFWKEFSNVSIFDRFRWKRHPKNGHSTQTSNGNGAGNGIFHLFRQFSTICNWKCIYVTGRIHYPTCWVKYIVFVHYADVENINLLRWVRPKQSFPLWKWDLLSIIDWKAIITIFTQNQKPILREFIIF